MEGFNDIWANILNGDIINNSENISEHPSLAVNQNNIEKKADLSATQLKVGDISMINKTEAEGSNQIKNVDMSKEEGQILQEITTALDKDARGTNDIHIQDQMQIKSQSIKEDDQVDQDNQQIEERDEEQESMQEHMLDELDEENKEGNSFERSQDKGSKLNNLDQADIKQKHDDDDEESETGVNKEENKSFIQEPEE